MKYPFPRSSGFPRQRYFNLLLSRKFSGNNPQINLSPKPLPLQTIVGLIILSSTCTMSFYLSYQLLNFIDSDNEKKHIFLPLWIDFNYFFKSKYSLSNLSILDIDNLTIDEGLLDNRIKFKVYNLLINNKILNTTDALRWKSIHLTQSDMCYKFQVNCPSVSGLKFVAHKDNEDKSMKNLDISVQRAIKLMDFKFFLLNQPIIETSDLSYTFKGEYALDSLGNVGNVKVNGIIERNNVMFESVVVTVDNQGKCFEYKVI